MKIHNRAPHILPIKVVGSKTLRYVIQVVVKVLIMQVLQRRIGSQTFIETLGI